MADETVIKLGLDVSEVVKGEKEFSRSAGRVEAAAKAMGKVVKDLNSAGSSGQSWIDKVAPSKSQTERLRSVIDVSKSMAQLSKDISAASKALSGVNVAEATRDIGAAFKAMSTQIQEANAAIGKTDLADLKEFVAVSRQAANLTKELGAVDRLRLGDGGDRQRVDAVKQAAAIEQQITVEKNKQAAAAERASQAAARRVNIADATNRVGVTREQIENNLRYSRSLEHMRFASQELRNHLTLLSTGVAALSYTFVNSAKEQERAFADVARTTQLSARGSSTLRELSNQLQELSSTSLSEPYEDLARIASLGAQMDIPTKRLTDFTEAVGGFTTITDVGVSEASENFGRIINTFQQAKIALNGASSGQEYKQLASQIAELGAKSVATEGEILKMTNSIAASAVSAGVGQDATLAYAAALTSVGIRAEWARGSMQRIFGKFNKDAAAGVDNMQKYADVLGVTAQEANNLWRTDPSKFFNNIIYSLNAITDPIEKAQAISSIGIVNTRDVQLLQRMSVNAGLLSKAMRDSAEAGADTGFFTSSLETLNATLAETINRFVNSFKNAAATFGEPFLAPVKLILNALNKVLQVLNDIGKTSVGRVFAAFAGGVVLFSALSAASKTLQFSVISVASSFIQMRARMAELGAQGPLSWLRIKQAIDQARNSVAATIPLYQRLQRESAILNDLAREHRVLSAQDQVKRTSGAVAGLADSAATVGQAKLAAATTAANTALKEQAVAAGASSVALSSHAATTGAVAVAEGAATTATWSLKTAFVALAGSNPLGWAITALSLIPTVITAIDELTVTADEAREKARASAQDTLQALGGDNAFLDAIKQDSQNYAKGVEDSYSDLKVAVGAAGGAAEGAADQWYYWLDAQGNIVQATMEAAKAQDLLALKTGEASRKIIANAFTQSEEFKSITGDQLRALAETGFDWGTYANKVSAGANGAEAAQAYADSFREKINQQISQLYQDKYIVQGDSASNVFTKDDLALLDSLERQKQALDNVKEKVLNVGGAFDTAAQQQLVYAQLTGDTSDATGRLSGDLEQQKEEWDKLVQSMQQYVDNAFATIDGTAAIYETMDALNQSVQENGNTFDVLTAQGRDNIEALEAYLKAIVDTATKAAEQLGLTGQAAQEYVHGQVQAAIDQLGETGFDLSGVEGAIGDLDKITSSDINGPTVNTSAFDQANANMVATAQNTVNQINAAYAGLPGGASVAGGRKYSGGPAGWKGVPYALPQTNSQRFLDRHVNRSTPRSASSARPQSTKTSTNKAYADGYKAAVERANQYRWVPKPSSRSTGGGGGGSRRPSSSGGGGGRPSSSGGSSRREKSPQEIFEDYLRRLSSAMKDALTSFWRNQDAQDGYHSQLNRMTKSIENANKNIQSLNQEVRDLFVTLSDQEQKLSDAQFFNSIARKYGDSERIKSTQRDINVAQNDIAKTKSSIEDKRREAGEISKNITILNGYSDAAIANRAALKSLQSQMIAMIDDYAAQGHSTQQVAAYTQQLKNEFIAQATQMGFNHGEVVRLAGAFDSLTYSINATPRVVNVAVSDNGSAARTGAAISAAATNNGAGYFSDINAKKDYPSFTRVEDSLEWITRERSALVKIKYENTSAGSRVYHGNTLSHPIAQTWARGGKVHHFSNGGYLNTMLAGNPNKDNLKGVGPHGEPLALRGGEYVIRKAAVDFYGTGLMDAINANKFNPRPVSSGVGGGSGFVSLNPNQINQLARAVSTVVSLDGRAISRNVNKQYAVSNSRGA